MCYTHITLAKLGYIMRVCSVSRYILVVFTPPYCWYSSFELPRSTHTSPIVAERTSPVYYNGYFMKGHSFILRKGTHMFSNELLH